MDEIQINLLTENDKPGTLELMQTVFSQQEHFKLQRNADWWSWKYEKSVFGKPIITTARTAGGYIVGARVFWPWHLQLNGKKLKAFQPVDTVVEPSYRGKGLFRKMTDLALEEAKQQHCDVLFNFPNQQSLYGDLNMGWKLLGKLEWSVKILRPMRILFSLNCREQYQPVEMPYELRFRSSQISREKRGKNFSDLVTAYAPPDFYRWRYEEHPFFKYGMITESHGEEKLHLIFSINENGKRRELSVVDIIGSPLCLEKAFKKLELAAAAMKTSFIAAINTNGYPMKKNLLKHGFLPVKKKNFALLALDPNLKESISSIQKWSLFGGMHDTL